MRDPLLEVIAAMVRFEPLEVGDEQPPATSAEAGAELSSSDRGD